jgi:HEAT repeat protein
VLVLSLIDAPVALEMIVGLISHKESRIRKEVLSFIERSPDPKAKNYLLKFLRDESSAIRIRALQILGRGKLSFALEPTLALTVADDFKTKDLAEKKVVYETIAELGAEQMIPLYRDMLLKKQWFKKNVDKNTAICAVAGLLKIRNEESLRLLEEARKQHTLEIRGVIDHAISIMSTVSEAPFGNAREV